MISKEQAEKIVLDSIHSESAVESSGYRYVVSSSYLSDDRDFWVVRANTEASVIGGDFLATAVGISAYLVDGESQEIFHVGSRQKVEDTIQDIRDEREAGDNVFILEAGSGACDNDSMIALRGVFPCSFRRARELLTPPESYWFTGRRRYLENYQRRLAELGLSSRIILVTSSSDAIQIYETTRFEWSISQIATRSTT